MQGSVSLKLLYQANISVEDSESDLQPSSSKRYKPSTDSSSISSQKVGISRKLSGAARYKTRFQHSWQEKWPFGTYTPVRGDPHSFRCNVCNKLVSCGHQGETDVSRHYESTQHKKAVAALSNTRRLNFKASSSVQLQKEKVRVVM